MTAPPAPATPAPAPAPAWWQTTGDAALAPLVAQGLAHDASIGCAIGWLREGDAQNRSHAKRIGTRINKLFGQDDASALDAQRDLRVVRIAERRQHLAERIALAYLEVRRLQQRAAVRKDLLDQYKDNAEIAEFRRQAGLVPAVDGALAGSQDEAARAELYNEDTRIADAVAALASLVGEDSAALEKQLGAVGAFPPWPKTAPAPKAAVGKDGPPDSTVAAPNTGTGPVVAVVTAMSGEAREKQLQVALTGAQRTVKDARGAYREGAGTMATLYVTEAAALTLDQALIDQQGQNAAQAIHEKAATDTAWSREGLGAGEIANRPHGPDGRTDGDKAVSGADHCD